MMIDPQGPGARLPGDAAAVHQPPGDRFEKVKVLPVGTPVVTRVATSANGCMIIADKAPGVLGLLELWVRTPLTAAPNDSTIISLVGTVSSASGADHPIIVGMNQPHGMAFTHDETIKNSVVRNSGRAGSAGWATRPEELS